ncbi:MAG TPA: amidohydrolase family protein [Terriglobales bacterium]|nr:amidohydrolase family protein [Terriglobales bacterium]
MRGKLNHPVIDTDGHTVELTPVFFDYLGDIGGSTMIERYKKAVASRANNRWMDLSDEERRYNRATCPPWWARPAKNTFDRATASLPRLLHERMDQLGMDFTVLYPTFGLTEPPRIEEEEVRRAACRALNAFHADIYRDYADRMTPVAVIPVHTPLEGIEELEYAVRQQGFKAAVISHVQRPVPKIVKEHPELAASSTYLDLLALDSDYDYDPFWAKCIELKVAVTTHATGQGWGSRRSVSNYMFNHIGHFGAAGEAMCKAIFFGGVTRRFPTLNFAFLEGGVHWACGLYADIVGHWKKRNSKAIHDLDPTRMDRQLLRELIGEYGDDRMTGKVDAIMEWLAQPQRHPENLDDWSACKVEKLEDLRDLFVPHFYFGCEADDPMVAWAFNARTNPMGVKFKAMMSSDIGHWDVTDMNEVVEEAYELVEDGLITEDDFRNYTFANAAGLYAEMNPDFFAGTICEQAVAKLLRETSKTQDLAQLGSTATAS